MSCSGSRRRERPRHTAGGAGGPAAALGPVDRDSVDPDRRHAPGHRVAPPDHGGPVGGPRDRAHCRILVGSGLRPGPSDAVRPRLPWWDAYSGTPWVWPPRPSTGGRCGSNRWPRSSGASAADMLFAVLGAIFGQQQMVQVDFLSLFLVVAVSSALLVFPSTASCGGRSAQTGTAARWCRPARRRAASGEADAAPPHPGRSPPSRSPRHASRGVVVVDERSARQPRMRPRKSVNVASLVGSPEDEPSRPNLRLRVVGVVVLVLFLVLVLRLWTLQIIDGKSYAAAVTRNQVRVVSVAAPRGRDRRPQRHRSGHQRPRARDPAFAPTRHAGPLHHRQGGHADRPDPAQVEPRSRTTATAPTSRCPWPQMSPAATVQYLQTHEADYPGRQRPDHHPAHLPPGGDDGDPRARIPGRHHARSWPPIQRRATPRAAWSGSRASKSSTSSTCGASTGARPSR